MDFPQLRSKDGRVKLQVGPRRARLLLDGKRQAAFDVHLERALSLRRARQLAELDPATDLVAAWSSSPDARELLRKVGVSYAMADGEIYVHAPPVHVEVPPAARRTPNPPRDDHPNLFALRASRVARWLLLHASEVPSVRELAKAVELSESSVSRAVSGLAGEGLVKVDADPADGRVRRVGVANPGRLLDAFELTTNIRRVRSSHWDIGARDAAAAGQRLRYAARRLGSPYAVGGIAGARAAHLGPVEPAGLDVWIARDDLDLWVNSLTAVPARPEPGTVSLNLAPDPFVLSLAEPGQEGWLVADAVQLYLDCRRAGERALEAADAIRQEMGW